MSKRTIVKDASYTAKDIDMVSIIIFNSAADCALTLPSPAGLIYADCDVHNKGTGTVTIGSQTVATGSHAHISNDGTAWVVVIGGGGGGINTETDPVFMASVAANITGENIANWNVAQKNSDITKAEIEAKLTGEISSHYHRTKPQQWKDYPDSPEDMKEYPYQFIADIIVKNSPNVTALIASKVEVYTDGLVEVEWISYEYYDGIWTNRDTYNDTFWEYMFVASNFDIYTTAEKTALVYARQNDDSVPTMAYYEPLVNGDPDNPEIMFDDDGDIIMVEV